jgi:hypothetical protein
MFPASNIISIKGFALATSVEIYDAIGRLEGKKIILKKLLNTEKLSGLNLISQEEINCIYKLWEIDEVNVNYQEKRPTIECIKHS